MPGPKQLIKAAIKPFYKMGKACVRPFARRFAAMITEQMAHHPSHLEVIRALQDMNVQLHARIAQLEARYQKQFDQMQEALRENDHLLLAILKSNVLGHRDRLAA